VTPIQSSIQASGHGANFATSSPKTDGTDCWDRHSESGREIDQVDLVNRDEGSRWVGFHHKAPKIEEVRTKITDQHSFLNLDDAAFSPKSGL
jgi:hypothetical protein